MPEKKRTFESNVHTPERLRVKPKAANRVGTDLRVCKAGSDAGVITEMPACGFSRETILRLIEWIKQV